MVSSMENLRKMDDLGGNYHYFRKHPYRGWDAPTQFLSDRKKHLLLEKLWPVFWPNFFWVFWHLGVAVCCFVGGDFGAFWWQRMDALNDFFVIINDILGVFSLKLGPQETFFLEV